MMIETEKTVPSQQKTLSILCNGEDFCFAEIDASRELLTFSEVINEDNETGNSMSDLRAFFSERGINTLGYKKVQLIIPSAVHTWVPNGLYDSNNNRQYLTYVGAEITKPSNTLTCHNRVLSATDIYYADGNKALAFRVALPGVEVMSIHSKLINEPLIAKSKEKNIVLTYWRKGWVDCVAMQEEHVTFSQSIEHTSDNQLLYELIGLIKILKITDKDNMLLLCGDVNTDTYKMVKPYFAHIDLYVGDVAMPLDSVFRGWTSYKYAPLMMQ